MQSPKAGAQSQRSGGVQKRNGHPLDAIVPQDVPCMRCGSCEAIPLNTALHFDFDPGLLPEDLRFKMVTRNDGVCFSCGLYQEYLRFTEDEMRRFATFNKDETVSEVSFKSFPIPDHFIAKFENQFVRRRTARWNEILASRGLPIGRALFLRPMFGGTASYIVERFAAECYGLEISSICRKTTEQRVPGMRFLNGQIHGLLDGEFLDEGPFDAIFVFHTLVHCIDIDQALCTIRSLLGDSGFAIFSDEIQMKPQNPFHNVFMTEWQLASILGNHFDSVDRIDDCVVDPPLFVTRFTSMSDSPDFLVRMS